MLTYWVQFWYRLKDSQITLAHSNIHNITWRVSKKSYNLILDPEKWEFNGVEMVTTNTSLNFLIYSSSFYPTSVDSHVHISMIFITMCVMSKKIKKKYACEDCDSLTLTHRFNNSTLQHTACCPDALKQNTETPSWNGLWWCQLTA